MIPPLLLHIKIREAGTRGFGLWLPLVLLWPLLFPLALLAVLAVLLVSLLTLSLRRGMAALFALYEMVCALRGLFVDVRNKNETVVIRIW